MSIKRLIKDAQTQVREVDPATIAAHLKHHLVVDVREPNEVLLGFLPGAINVPRGTMEFRVSDDPRFGDPQRAILVYSGSGKRSALAALTLSQLGFSNVQSLAGGIKRWSEENGPIE
ncbi:MAG: rhodanese-like domain-containing protein [Gammaproteobacteria bacterium]|nr:rhodanese-like domain-containing protein [Gammaproteobacteria bacterium]